MGGEGVENAESLVLKKKLSKCHVFEQIFLNHNLDQLRVFVALLLRVNIVGLYFWPHL